MQRKHPDIRYIVVRSDALDETVEVKTTERRTKAYIAKLVGINAAHVLCVNGTLKASKNGIDVYAVPAKKGTFNRKHIRNSEIGK